MRCAATDSFSWGAKPLESFDAGTGKESGHPYSEVFIDSDAGRSDH